MANLVYVINKISWTDLKALATSKSLRPQYIEKSDSYVIYLIENGYNVYTNINKETPRNSDQADFEDNFKAGYNQKLLNRVSLTDSNNNEVSISSNNNLQTSDILNNSGIQGAVSVSTSAVAARVGGSNLTNRKSLTIFNNGTSTIYWGFTNAVTSSTGTPLMRNQYVNLEVGPSTTVYLIAASGTHDTRITEAA